MAFPGNFGDFLMTQQNARAQERYLTTYAVGQMLSVAQESIEYVPGAQTRRFTLRGTSI